MRMSSGTPLTDFFYFLMSSPLAVSLSTNARFLFFFPFSAAVAVSSQIKIECEQGSEI